MRKQPTESQQPPNFRSTIENAVVFGAAIGPFSGGIVAFVGGWLAMPILQSLHLLSTEPKSEDSGLFLAFVLALAIGFTAGPFGALVGWAMARSSKQTNSIISVGLVVGIIQATFLTAFTSLWSGNLLILYSVFTVVSNLIVAFSVSKFIKRT